jgi:hypothetical protein
VNGLIVDFTKEEREYLLHKMDQEEDPIDGAIADSIYGKLKSELCEDPNQIKLNLDDDKLTVPAYYPGD